MIETERLGWRDSLKISPVLLGGAALAAGCSSEGEALTESGDLCPSASIACQVLFDGETPVIFRVKTSGDTNLDQVADGFGIPRSAEREPFMLSFDTSIVDCPDGSHCTQGKWERDFDIDGDGNAVVTYVVDGVQKQAEKNVYAFRDLLEASTTKVGVVQLEAEKAPAEKSVEVLEKVGCGAGVLLALGLVVAIIRRWQRGHVPDLPKTKEHSRKGLGASGSGMTKEEEELWHILFVGNPKRPWGSIHRDFILQVGIGSEEYVRLVRDWMKKTGKGINELNEFINTKVRKPEEK